MTEVEKDKIFKTLLKIQKNYNKPDLHSFTAKVKDGSVYVEGRVDGCYVEHCIGDKKYQYYALPVAVSNILIQLEVDLSTIEI